MDDTTYVPSDDGINENEDSFRGVTLKDFLKHLSPQLKELNGDIERINNQKFAPLLDEQEEKARMDQEAFNKMTRTQRREIMRQREKLAEKKRKEDIIAKKKKELEAEKMAKAEREAKLRALAPHLIMTLPPAPN